MKGNTEFSIVSFLNKVRLMVAPVEYAGNEDKGYLYTLFDVNRSISVGEDNYSIWYNVSFLCVKDLLGRDHQHFGVALWDSDFVCMYNLDHKISADVLRFKNLVSLLRHLKCNFISSCWAGSDIVIYSKII